VLDSVTKNYYKLSPAFRIALAQQWLYVYGYDVGLSGTIDAKTIAALKKFDPKFPDGAQELPERTFVDLYLNMPFDAAALGRRAALNDMIDQAVAKQQAAPEAQTQASQPQQQSSVAPSTRSAGTSPAASAPSAKVNEAATFKSTGFGRKLTDAEW
jgi:hypothetical protein